MGKDKLSRYYIQVKSLSIGPQKTREHISKATHISIRQSTAKKQQQHLTELLCLKRIENTGGGAKPLGTIHKQNAYG